MRCGRQKEQNKDNVSENSFKNRPSFERSAVVVTGEWAKFLNRRPSEEEVEASGPRSNNVPGEEGGEPIRLFSVRV
jgi:hypothetical protein